jgi:hypothetical protein
LGVVKRLETAAKRQLAAMGDEVAWSALAEAAVLLAKRLDAGVPDYVAPALVRELRLTMADLRSQAGEDGPGEVEAFLARIAAPELGHAAH